jgi:hypothetical protein
MLAPSPAEVIPRTRQAIGSKQTMVTVFFTAGKLVVLGVLPEGSTFNQFCCINHFFGFENGKAELLSSDATIGF